MRNFIKIGIAFAVGYLIASKKLYEYFEERIEDIQVQNAQLIEEVETLKYKQEKKEADAEAEADLKRNVV